MKICNIKYSGQKFVYSCAQLFGFLWSALCSPSSALCIPCSALAGSWVSESKELSTGSQRAEHKNRHISGRNTLCYKFSKIKHFMMNWNIFGAFQAHVMFMVHIHFKFRRFRTFAHSRKTLGFNEALWNNFYLFCYSG